MVITNTLLNALRTTLREEFKRRLAELDADPTWKALATVIPSNSESNTYGWLGAFPQMRQWVGSRVIRDIAEHGYQIFNEKWEATLGIKRTHIEDDNLGMYRVLSASKADEYARFMNRHVAKLIENGFADFCYDGQPFFSDSHPVFPNTDGTGTATDVSNIVGDPDAAGRPWALLCLSGTLKPFIVQRRAQLEFDSKTDTGSDHVFMLDEFLYGIRYRGSFGYGLWQQAVASKDDLNPANYKQARLVMQTFKRDGGDPLGIVPTHLVVDPTNEAAARQILSRELIGGGDSNPDYNTAQLIVVPHL